MDIRVFAHRGGALNAQENTISAFRAAFANGAEGIECDIRKTSDGHFVAFHDKTAVRMTGRNWPISGTTYGQLKNLKVGGTEPIPHLDDILNLLIFHPTKICYFEVCFTDPDDAGALALQIKKAGIQNRCFILAFSHEREMLRAAKQAVPDIGLAVMPLWPSDIISTAKLAQADAVCAGWTPAWPGTRELFRIVAGVTNFKYQVQAAAAAGINVSAGVANNYYDVRWLADQGVGAVWTDDVRMAVRALYGG